MAVDNAMAYRDSQMEKTQTAGCDKLIATPEQAEALINSLKKSAQELSEAIYLLSILYVKDDKTDTEYQLEQEYIKQLTSKEMQDTMRKMIANKKMLDADTVTCIEDFLDGYIHHDKEMIPIDF